MTDIILAAGENTRYQGTIPKQLLDVKGETVIGRIIRQLRARGREPFVATHEPSIAAHCDCRLINPSRRRYTPETLLSTESVWGNRLSVWLGDVVYSKAAMDLMCNFDQHLAFFGDKYEIYGIGVDYMSFGNLKEGLKAVIGAAERLEIPGKLRPVFRWMAYGNMRNESIAHHHFVTVDDYTVDFDTPERYRAFLREVVFQNGLDDLPVPADLRDWK